MPNPTPADVTAWLTNRLPEEWRATSAPEITVDREEIVVLLAIAAPEVADQSTAAAAVDGRVAGFRDETRVTGASRSRSRPRGCSSARCRGARAAATAR